MFQRNLDEWLANLANPVLAPQHRVMLLDVGSEFKRWRQLDPRRVNISTDDAALNLIGPDVSLADQAAGSRKLNVPDGECFRVSQINYWYREAADGALTPAIENSRLRLLFGKEESEIFPSFALGEFARGGSQLRFGAIPIGEWLLPERQLTLQLIPSGSAGSAFDVYVSLLLRSEPRVLIEAAGLVNPRGM